MTITDIATRRDRVAPLQFDYAPRATQEINRCNACGHGKHYLLSARDRYGFPVKTRVCERCGLGWISPRMRREDYVEFYAKWYRNILSAWYGYDWSGEKLIESQTNYVQCLEKSARLVLELQRKAGGTLLDVGGSTGVIAAWMRDAFGMQPTVLDPCEDELVQARERGLETILGFAEDAPAWRKFDVIILLQTLEHLLDPRMVLLKLKAMLNPGGILLFDFVPFCVQRANVHPIDTALKCDHPFYFSKYAVDEMLATLGLQVRTFLNATPRQYHYVVEAA